MVEKKRILITGGLGFLGSNLARRLVDMNCAVTLMDSMIPEYGGLYFNIHGIADKVQVNISDMRDRYSLAHLVRDKDIIFNLAGQTSHVDSMNDPLTDMQINCAAQLSLLEIIRAHNPEVKVVFASTRQIYGRPQYLPVDEQHPLSPVDVNGIHKIAAESYHLLYSKIYDFRTCVLRLTNTIGPGMRVRDARQTFVGSWVKQLLEGDPIEVWGGEQLRDFNYVDDVVDAFLLAADCEAMNGRALNLGSEQRVSLRALATMLIAANNGNGEFLLKNFPEISKKIDIGDYYANYSEFNSVTGWQPRISLEDALTRTVDFYKKNLRHYIE